MARRYKTYTREEKAVEFRVTVEGLEEYKDAWLIIWNNARTYPETMYKVANDSTSMITVLANPEHRVAVGEFLSQFGEVKESDEDKYVVFVDVESIFDDWDKDYVDYEYVFGELDQLLGGAIVAPLFCGYN